MAITISGQNNNDKILASDGVLDSISGFNVVGVMTAANFDVTGKTTTGHLNVGSNIQVGNAGIITATTLIGNVTGNINHTSNLLLQIGGSEKFRVGSSGQLGIGGANYGSSGQVLTSGGSGSAPTWSTINSDKITEGNTEAEVVDTGSDGHFKVTTEGSERLRVDSSGRVLIGTTTEGYDTGDNLTIASNGHTGITIRSGTSAGGNIFFSDGTSGADEYRGNVSYDHTNNFMRFYVNAAERLRITSDGNIGINDTAPPNFTGYKSISIHGSTGGALVFGDDGTDEWEIYGGDGVVKIYDRANTQERIRISDNGAIGLGGANYGSSGQVLTSGGSGSAVSWTTISSDLVSDTSPQLGGDLASNGSDIKFANNDKAIFGTGNDAAIYHNDTDFHIDAQASGATRGIYITAGTVSSPFIELRTDNGESMLKCLPDDGVFLYHNNNLKLRTTSAGTEFRGDVHFDNHTNTGKDIYWDESNDRLSFNDSVHATFGVGEDLRIFHDGTTNHIKGTGSHTTMFWTSNVERWYIDSNGHFKPGANGNYDIGASNARVRNVYISDLNLSNEGQSNDVDGTWGDWTLQEGEHKIYMINNRTGKKYSLKMEEE